MDKSLGFIITENDDLDAVKKLLEKGEDGSPFSYFAFTSSKIDFIWNVISVDLLDCELDELTIVACGNNPTIHLSQCKIKKLVLKGNFKSIHICNSFVFDIVSENSAITHFYIKKSTINSFRGLVVNSSMESNSSKINDFKGLEFFGRSLNLKNTNLKSFKKFTSLYSLQIYGGDIKKIDCKLENLINLNIRKTKIRTLKTVIPTELESVFLYDTKIKALGKKHILKFLCSDKIFDEEGLFVNEYEIFNDIRAKIVFKQTKINKLGVYSSPVNFVSIRSGDISLFHCPNIESDKQIAGAKKIETDCCSSYNIVRDVPKRVNEICFKCENFFKKTKKKIFLFCIQGIDFRDSRVLKKNRGVFEYKLSNLEFIPVPTSCLYKLEHVVELA